MALDGTDLIRLAITLAVIAIAVYGLVKLLKKNRNRND